MFKKPAIKFGLLFLLCGLLVVCFLLPGRANDREEYLALERLSNPTEEELSTTHYAGKQKRLKVSKDIWFANGEKRLNFRINSENSRLHFTNEGGGAEVTEHMENVLCYMQERLYFLLPNGKRAILKEEGGYLIEGSDPNEESSWINPKDAGLIPMQEIRFIRAKKALYDYNDNQFLANDVYIYHYTVPGHELVEELDDFAPLMSGRADAVEFSLMGHSPHFQARHFKAIFHSWRDKIS